MKNSVLVGSSIPPGVEQLRVHEKLKLGNIVLTMLPDSQEEALRVANYCREHKIYLCFSELLYRGSYDLCWAYRRKMPRSEFYSQAALNEIIDAAGEYYFGRVCIGEAGGVLYWPKAYTINRRAREWESLTFVRTAQEAREAYVKYLRQWLDYERKKLGKGPLMNVDSASLLCKYQSEAGVDILCLEAMPGDPHLMHAAIRGTARAYGKPWGAHIAMQCYGGVSLDELWQKRWKTSLYYSYIAGAEFIYPESGHYTYHQNDRHFGFHNQEMKRVRRTLRELYQFSCLHTRPPSGPRVTFGVIHGNLDGTPGLWSRYVWGQYKGKKWLEGPAERGWRFVDKFHRKEEWSTPYVQGEVDFSGNPPYGQYDVLPLEAPLELLKSYTCLVFLSWNTMTGEIYNKLKEYVKAGGHLVMYLPHLSTHTDRDDDLKLFRNGDFRDLFGLRVLGQGKAEVMGIKCLANSSLPAYKFPFWRINTDPRFLGKITPARVKVTTARVLSSYDDYYHVTPEKLARQPVLVENALGKGKAFLVTVWQYPGDEGIRLFTEDLLRTILAGEQGSIRLLSGDRVRYAVYEGKLPGSPGKYSVVYLLNTDPDCPTSARLWLGGKTTELFHIPANALRIAYCCGKMVLIPEDRRVDLKTWRIGNGRYEIEFYSAGKQKLGIYNLGKTELTISINKATYSCAAGGRKFVVLKRTVDPARKKFFGKNFLEEPQVQYKDAGLPY